MTSKQFSETEQATFWQLNHKDYKGDYVSGFIVRWAKDVIGSRVADVGAGSGALVRQLRKSYPKLEELTGLDIAPKSPEILKGSCTKLPFADNSFDTLFMTDVIEHLSDGDLDLSLSEMRRVLSPGGHMVITTINNETLDTQHVGCPSCGTVFHRWGHCQKFSIERFASLAAKYDLEFVRSKTTNMGRAVSYGLLSRLVYLFAIDRIFRPASWHEDLMVVLRKPKSP